MQLQRRKGIHEAEQVWLRLLFLAAHATLPVMVPYMYEQFISNLTYEVKSGNIPMSRSDDVVARILQVKFETGLFEDPYANKGLKSFIGQQVITYPHDS
jgi:beta-glucosidase-like glycosyl hydrolase